MSEEKKYVLWFHENEPGDYNDKIRENPNKKDTEKQKKYENKYLYHLDVLPHPYFGDVENAKILFLAENPSYDKFEDEYDTWLYMIRYGYPDLSDKNDKYYDVIKKVNMFKSFSDENNRLFFNAWKWWNKNVIGDNVSLKDDYKGKVAFMNLSGYHSKKYNSLKLKQLSNLKMFGNRENEWKSSKNVELIVCVWGKNEWKKLLGDKMNDENTIILNNRQNITTIEQILNSEDDNRYNVIKDFFQKKSN